MKTVLIALALMLSPQLINTGHHRVVALGGPCAGTVACYLMNEGSGVVFHDGSSNGNNVTASSPSNFTWQSNTGFPGTTGLFNGTPAGAAASSGTPTNFSSTQPFTVTCWVYFNSVSVNQSLIGTLAAGPGYQGWELTLIGQSLNIYLINNYGGGNYLEVYTAYNPISANTLYMVGFTYDGSMSYEGMSAIINGVQKSPPLFLRASVNALTGSIAGGVAPNLAERASSGGQALNGVMAFARVYNSVLTSDQIANIYAAGPQ
jgi:hypothetical protein